MRCQSCWDSYVGVSAMAAVTQKKAGALREASDDCPSCRVYRESSARSCTHNAYPHTYPSPAKLPAVLLRTPPRDDFPVGVLQNHASRTRGDARLSHAT